MTHADDMTDDELFADPDAVIPGIRWWEGPTSCAICGWRGRSVIPIAEEHEHPVVPMECPDCGHMTLAPNDEESAR